ncbi:MAG: putative DNA binding domain-containing protein [Bacteroidales bacterium]|nr:putative DNA binding domain-containing protein [Bacteroidales bacterium]
MLPLTSILSQPESSHLEGKSAKGGFPDSFWESYSAFANSDGGVIILGVEEDSNGKLCIKDGLKDAPKMKETFWKLVNNRQKISHNIVLEKCVYILESDGKQILVVEIPRAERTVRPVYKGNDPRNGTYKRFGTGDHLCTAEEVGAMLRDSSISPLDAVAVEDINLTALNMETVRGYRQMFKLTNPSHLWNTLDDEIFLRRIRATGAAQDGQYHPTEAGLLMFGYEYEITRRFPQYFLDYQEDRKVVGVAQWKDRIVSSSGDWSGNLFDFAMKILTKLQSDLKIPFVVKGFQRIDDTPLHRLMREAVTNCLVHADYYGRQGIVVSKNSDGFIFANPGGMRIPTSEALAGGVSDPRNATLLKMFSFIRFGERAGSGLNGIVYVWEKVFHTAPEIFVKHEYDRTFLKLPTLGKEPDMEAMTEFYPDEEEETNDPVNENVTANVRVNGTVNDPINENVTANVTANDPINENGTLNGTINDHLNEDGTINGTLNDPTNRNVTKNDPINGTLNEDGTINGTLKSQIMDIIRDNPNVNAIQLTKSLNKSLRQIRRFLAELQASGSIRRVGAKKNGHWEVINNQSNK